MEVFTQLIPVGHPNRCGQKITPIGIVIHYTANDSPTATDTANVKYIGRTYEEGYYLDSENTRQFGYLEYGSIVNGLGKKFRCGSAQWFIDQDSATLAIPQNEVAWGCGDRCLPYDNGYLGQTKIAHEVFNHQQNYLTINYELCNNADWQKTCDNALPIIAKDMIKNNIPITMVYRHYDLSGKICPKPFVDNPKAWEDFKYKLSQEIIKEMVSMFADQNRIAPWALDSVNRVASLGLIKGNDKGEFLPLNPITRQEFAVVIDRLLRLLGK